MQSIASLSNAELFSNLKTMCREERSLLGRILVYLGEVEPREAELKMAFSSMFDFCTRGLGMSEGATNRRLAATRLVHRFPQLGEAVSRGDLQLSTLVLLRAHVTDANCDELIAMVAGRSAREVERALAAYAPKPDVPATITPIPEQASLDGLPGDAAPREEPAPPPPPPRGPVSALSAGSFLVQFTASAEVEAKIQRALELESHSNPKGDLALLFERALDVHIARLEKQRLGKTDRPQTKMRETQPGTIPVEVVRRVYARDGEQCTYLSEDGQRCPCRRFLQLDHIVPQAQGGTDDEDNLRVRCWAHNLHAAKQVFGFEYVESRIDEHRRRRRSPEQESIALRVESGLVNLGFDKKMARRAVGDVMHAHEGDEPPAPAEQILREAIGRLT